MALRNLIGYVFGRIEGKVTFIPRPFFLRTAPFVAKNNLYRPYKIIRDMFDEIANHLFEFFVEQLHVAYSLCRNSTPAAQREDTYK